MSYFFAQSLKVIYVYYNVLLPTYVSMFQHAVVFISACFSLLTLNYIQSTTCRVINTIFRIRLLCALVSVQLARVDGAIYLPRLACVNNSDQVNRPCMEKGAMSRGYLLSFQNLKRFSHHLNSKNNGLNSVCFLSL